MKGKGNFDFGNKGIYDIKTETKDQSVVEADKSTEKKSIFELTKGAKAELMASDAGPEFKAAISKASVLPKKKKLKDMPDAQRKAVFASGYKG